MTTSSRVQFWRCLAKGREEQVSLFVKSTDINHIADLRVDSLESDDDLQEPSAQSNRKGEERFDRAPSSSPPAPEMDLPPPQIE